MKIRIVSGILAYKIRLLIRIKQFLLIFRHASELGNLYKLFFVFINMDFGFGEKRRTKGDLKMKRRLRAYKKGGKFRSSEASQDKK